LTEAYDEVKSKFLEICPEATGVLPTKKSLQSVCTRRKSISKRAEEEMGGGLDDTITENGDGGSSRHVQLEARLRLLEGNNPFGYQQQAPGSSSSSSNSLGGLNPEVSSAMPSWLVKSVDAAVSNAIKPLLDRIQELEQRVQALEPETISTAPATADDVPSSNRDSKRRKVSTAAK